MTISSRICAVLISGLWLPMLWAQNFDPPPPKLPDAKTLDLIQHRTVKLREAVEQLPKKLSRSTHADVEIYLKAAEWMTRHRDYYHADAGKWTLSTLEQGLQRAKEAAAGQPSWLAAKPRMTGRGYYSSVDGSVQPYAVQYPVGYAEDPRKKWRLDIQLHGRDSTISEAKFLAQHAGNKDTAKDQNFVLIDIYGRGNNAYRWAGETDVFEVLESFLAAEKEQGRDLIDPQRIVLRGFSMGGAGTWHLGLHHPDRFAVIGPGAGFTTTQGYIKGMPNPLPVYQQSCLHIYDAVDYAENAYGLPIVAYSGEKDPQRAAAMNIEGRLKTLKIDTMTHLIAPGLEHQFPAEWVAKAKVEWAKYAGEGKGRAVYPEHVRFVTYTLRYPRRDWVELLGLDRHYTEAKVDAQWSPKTFTVTTKNVRRLRLTAPANKFIPTTVTLDGQRVEIEMDQPLRQITFAKSKEKWAVDSGPKQLEKVPGLQGPIDDAFMTGFVCVKPVGKGWHEATGAATNAQYNRFEREWDQWMRGKLPTQTAGEITPEMLASKNLILFGDPESNPLIARILPKLPMQWTKTEIVFGDQKYDASKHLPMLIYPNPLNPKKYVVINSGHTFHDAEFRGTNAQLYPRLGDYAIVRPNPTGKDPAAFELVTAGLFDEFWQKSPHEPIAP